MWAGLGEEKGSALDFAEISLAADSGAFEDRENLQMCLLSALCKPLSSFTFVIKTDIMSVCRECVGLYTLMQQSHIFFLKTSPHTHISSSV